jgi:beta-N-acetylhexosaminidase
MSDYTAGMSLEEQIGQLFMVGFPGTEPTPEIADLIQQGKVGGIIFFSRNIRDARQVQALTGKLQALARAAGHRRPLLIATDQENGIVRRLSPDTTPFPGNMALGAIGSEEIVAEVAEATGRELRALGITMNFAPVADINNNPTNPVIGVRSFGEDAQQVARLVAAAVRGYRAAGVAHSLKHFPGHGDTSTDSHLALPVIPHDIERLDAVELVPFKSGIAAGADSVMIAHVALPATDGLPATVSSAVVRGLLRERLGYDGVIVSDCLEMQAVADSLGTPKGAIMAVQAGIDLVLVSHRYDRQRDSIAAVRAAVAAGEIDPAIIRLAAERVMALKHRLPSWDELPTETDLATIGSAEHRELSSRSYGQSVTLARDDGAIPLRLRETDRVLVVTPEIGSVTQAVDIPFIPEALVEDVRRRHANTGAARITREIDDAGRQALLDSARAADWVILVTLNAHLDEHQAELAREIVAIGRPTIGIAVCNPYDIGAIPTLRTALATYDYTPAALAAATRVIFGEIAPQGRLPVSIA